MAYLFKTPLQNHPKISFFLQILCLMPQYIQESNDDWNNKQRQLNYQINQIINLFWFLSDLISGQWESYQDMETLFIRKVLLWSLQQKLEFQARIVHRNSSLLKSSSNLPVEAFDWNLVDFNVKFHLVINFLCCMMYRPIYNYLIWENFQTRIRFLGLCTTPRRKKLN